MEIQAIKCLICGDIIYSRCAWDMRSCSCGYAGVVGYYYTVLVIPDPHIKKITLQLPPNITHQTLLDDWQYKNHKFGHIKHISGLNRAIKYYKSYYESK